MSALLDSLVAGFEGEAVKRTLLDDVLRDGLPAARNESWKYTSLRALERRVFAAPEAGVVVDAAALADIPAPRLVFVNGRFDAAHSSFANLPGGVTLQPRSGAAQSLSDGALTPASATSRDAVFARLALALAADGVLLQVAEGVRASDPIHLVFLGEPVQADAASHVSHLVALGVNASAIVVEHHLHGQAHANLSNALTRIELAAGSSLLHARIQDESTRATLMARTDVVLEENAHYERVDLELGAALSRHDLTIKLQGSGARVSANGVLLGTGRRHIDTQLAVEHLGRNTVCDLLWRGLGAGRSRTVFHGGIVIQNGADGADARLSNKNLLLGEGAEIDTQPVLEIHADEVKAAHGATVGQLDPTAMFYLRSRGLTESDARRLLTSAFCREVAVGAPAAVRDVLTRALERSLATLDME